MKPSKPPKDPLSLVPIEGAVGVALVDEHPFASDNVAASGTVNQVPGVIGKQGHMLVLHSTTLVRIYKSTTSEQWHKGDH
jgi:hypothetical protein